MFFRMKTEDYTKNCSGETADLKKALEEAEAVVIGAGSGLSTSAGFTYAGERFEKYFHDFAEKYGIRDMYSGGFYPFENMNIFWAWWSRMIWLNRYMDAPKPVYQDLLELVKDKDYFVITTNVDHCFQKAGFDKKRLFYTQGDYGLLQSADPKEQKTYDNEDLMRKMLEAQGFVIGEDNDLTVPSGVMVKMEIPSDLIPYSEEDHCFMTTNLRADDSFVEDAGWHEAAERYSAFLGNHDGMKVLFWEMGVGMNTPVIIKFPFWRYTKENPNAMYACLNYGEAYVPKEIASQSICINGDIGEVLKQIR